MFLQSYIKRKLDYNMQSLDCFVFENYLLVLEAKLMENLNICVQFFLRFERIVQFMCKHLQRNSVWGGLVEKNIQRCWDLV